MKELKGRYPMPIAKNPEANRAYWEMTGDAALSMYGYYQVADKPVEELPRLDSYSWSRYAFNLRMVGLVKEGCRMAEVGVYQAMELYRTNEFHPLLTPDVPPFRELNRARGEYRNLDSWFFCDWMLNGTPQYALLAEANEHHSETYAIFKNLKGFGFNKNTDGVRRYVAAQQFEEGLALFRQQKPNLIGIPTDMRFAGSYSHTCAVFAEYKLGNTDMEPIARKAVERWFNRSVNEIHNIEFHYWVTLGWADMWCRHFLGITELQPMLKLLRGY